MLAAELPAVSPHLHHPKHGGRQPLQPRNTILTTTNHDPSKKAKCQAPFSVSSLTMITDDSMNNKENIPFIDSMDASLAEELTAVKKKLERIKYDKDKTEKMLQERDRTLEIQMNQLLQRGEFQKELELEVDRLFRLNQLKLASMRMSPIRSLREKEMEKNNKNAQFELNVSEKSGESKEELNDKMSTTESPILSLTSSSASASASASTASKSTATSKIVVSIPVKLSLESDFDDE
ncbi:unnamed protein product [Amaranthus hypochondriacus]